MILTGGSAQAQLLQRDGGSTSAISAQAEQAPQAQAKFRTAGVRTTRTVSELSQQALSATALARPNQMRVLASNAQLPDLRGIVAFNDAMAGQNPTAKPGYYKILNGSTELIFEGPSANGGAIWVDDLLYTTSYTSFWGMLFISTTVYDEDGGTVTSFDSNVDNIAVGGLVQDPSTGTIYGITYNANGDGLQLATLNFTTTGVTTTAIAPLEGNWNSIAIDSTGQLYGINYVGSTQDENYVVTESSLYMIDKNNGSSTLIGNTGMIPQYLSSACIDPATNKMYWNVCAADDSGIIAEVNLATGQATKICDLALNDEIFGMFVAKPAAADGAPAAAENLVANFANGSLSGTVEFKTPALLFGGSAASGDVNYTVSFNDVVKATGTAQFNSNVSVPVTVDAAGEYKVVVVLSNSVGNSPKTKTTLFIGNGVPASPAPTATYVDGVVTVTWEAVTSTVDGGYIDASAVTYKVTRQPENVVVAESQSATTFTENIPEPEELISYTYDVVAINGTAQSAAGHSNAIALGSIVPPYAPNCTAVDALPAGFTTLDGNEDGKEWGPSNQGFKMGYNSKMAMDDYLILPPLKLEGGKMYMMTFDAFASSKSYSERLEVKMGSAPTVAGLSTTLIPATEITQLKDDPHHLSCYLLPETNGIYYVAIHGISDKDRYNLYVNELKIGAASSTQAPAACTDITVTPDPNGALKATVSFKAPALDLGGNALTGITEIIVTRGDDHAQTFQNPTVGAPLSFEDILPASGNYVYTIQANNEYGAGASVQSESVFVGFGEPAAPENVNMVEEGNTGKVTITWDAVTKDVDGRVFPNPVTYIIAEYGSYGWTPITEEISGTSYELQAVEAGSQAFAQYAVFPSYDGETGSGTATPMIAVGTPYTDVAESFADGQLHYIWGTGYSNGASWSVYNDSSFSDIAGQDGDNGYAASNGNYLNDCSSLFTGKIDLTGAANPGVSYYTFNINEADTNEMLVYVREVGNEEWTLLNTAVVNEVSEVSSWGNVVVSLAAYVGKTIQVRFESSIQAYKYTFLDNVKIGSLLGNDLVAREISAPTNVNAGSDYNVSVIVGNNGTLDATAFDVKLYADGELVETKNVEALASGTSTTVEFARNMSAVASAPIVYYAVVEYAADENTANNTTGETVVAPKFTSLPAIADLAGSNVAEGVKLTWSEPNLEGGVNETKTETFEECEGFVHEVEGWTFIDEDGSEVGGFQNMDVPGITPGQSKASFFVWDSSQVGNQTFAAHNGDKYLAALFRYDDGQTSDWAISPILSGNAQTVSFYAKSYSNQYPEKIEIYYGNGTSVSDYSPETNLIKTVNPVPAEWTLVEVEIPAGATNFAIHSCASGSFMLMIDDVTYEAGSTTSNLSIVGYDVYRDGLKLTEQPTGECEFVDANATEGEHTYQVVVVYNRGISAPSNSVTVEVSGLANIEAGVRVSTADGCIIVAGAEGRNLVVNAINGTTVYAGTADATTRVAVAGGVYLVKVDSAVTKVIVR